MKHLTDSYPNKESVELWAEELPDLIQQLTSSWQIKPQLSASKAGNWSLVVPCLSRQHGQLALKLCPDIQALARQGAALTALPSPPSVKLIKQHPEALLLEWLPEAKPVNSMTVQQQADLLESLQQSVSGAAASDLGTWEEYFIVQRISRIRQLSDRASFPEATKLILEISDQLSAQAEGHNLVVSHGDLYPPNILQGSFGMRVIDPCGVMAAKEFDIANLAINYSSPTDNIAGNITQLADRMQASRSLALIAGRSYALLEAVHHRALRTDQAYRSDSLMQFAKAG